MKSPVLVTGGEGFIGSRLVAKLAARGCEVHVLDPKADPARSTEGVIAHPASILDEAALRRAVAGKATVFHLAAKAMLWARDPEIYERVNHEGTRAVLTACEEAKVGCLVVTSTALVLRDWRRHYAEPVSEVSARPLLDGMPGPYARSKWRADQAVCDAADRGFPAISVYPTAPVGPPDGFLTEPTKMLQTFLTRPPPAYLETRLNLVDVDDVADAHILAAEQEVPGGHYLLAGEDLSFSELLTHLERFSGRVMPRRRIPYIMAALAAHAEERIAQVTGRPPSVSLEGVRSAKFPPTFEAEAAVTELGWRPRPVLESLERTVRAIQNAAELN